MRHRFVLPLVLLSALFVAAGGFIHLREWFETYRDLPAQVPGREVVVVGFPINVATSVLAVVALGVAYLRFRRFLLWVVGAVAAFQVGSLAFLILSRTGSVLGWTEPEWTTAASQARAVEIAALVALAATAGLVLRRRATGADVS